jgi:hypothetical protein
MSSLTPVRDDPLGAARPFGLWISRRASWFPMKRRGDPGLGPLFNVAWLRRDSNLGQIGARTSGRICGAGAPSRLHPTALRQSRQAVVLCACEPSAFSRPRQWTTLGLPSPMNLPIASGASVALPSGALRFLLKRLRKNPLWRHRQSFSSQGISYMRGRRA